MTLAWCSGDITTSLASLSLKTYASPSAGSSVLQRAAAARGGFLELAVGPCAVAEIDRHPVRVAPRVLGDVIDYAAFHMKENLREQYEKAQELGKPAFLERPYFGSPGAPAQAETN